MRCYHLNNFYLSGIHAGIQTAHAQHELAMRYLSPDVATGDSFERAQRDYINWAKNHKTIIVLNAGMQVDLESWIRFLDCDDHPYAWAGFREDDLALNGALTNIGIVLPPKMYTYTQAILPAMTRSPSTTIVGAVTVIAEQSLKVDVVSDGHRFTVVRYMEDQANVLQEVAEKWTYTAFEVELLQRLARLKLM